ncbi:MAG: xanthine dehydrogenase family protein molybdopterin-binding subunit [Candidatus Methanomethylicia archaeon]
MEEASKLIEKWLKAEEFLIVGKSIERVDAIDKVTGKAKFMEDHHVPKMLYVKLVTSSEPHAKILKINYEKAIKIPGVVRVITSRDITGENQVGYALPDQPLIAYGKVRYHGEPIALVAAETPESAIRGAMEVYVEYEKLPAILDPMEAMNRRDILVHENKESNIAFTAKVRRGNVKIGFDKSDIIIENNYRTQHQEHLYLETEGALAIPERGGEYTILSCAQYPHLAQAITARVLGIPTSKIRIVQPFIGGGFGGKDDTGPLVTAQAALVSYLTGRPALLIYSRDESFKVHCKREQSIIRYKSGATIDGKLMAIDVDIIMDSGAYANRGPFILWRATMHASGPYQVEYAKVDGYCVYTNKVYQGSFRGFGNPDIQFAAEAQMDELARKLGIDPIDFRLKNILKPGSTTITGQVLEESVGIGEALRLVAEKADWWNKRKMYEAMKGRYRKGIGVGCGWHGISTSRGVPDWSNAVVKVNKDGGVEVYTGITEIGQGSPTTSHVQIVSEILGLPTNNITIHFGTTDAPDAGATHASRGTSIGAIGVLVAAAKIRERLTKLASEILGCSQGDVKFENGRIYTKNNPMKRIGWKELVNEAFNRGVELSATGYFYLPKGSFDHEVGQGYAYPAYSYIVNIIEVEVDMETGVTRVLKAYPALASGRIINPIAVEGQIEGAIAQGMGLALMEKIEFDDKGAIINSNLTDYVIPIALDMPKIEKTVFIEDLFKYGPFGAKGVGEMALIPTPAAIANAVAHAIGKRICELPLTPEKIYFKIRGDRYA